MRAKPYFMVMVTDMRRAAEFYKDVSNARIASEPQARPGEPIVLATAVDTEGDRISLSQPKR